MEPSMSQVKMEKGKGVATDRAKANYLSGQLRLRLQYAKLKVEHGWQRQSLNEVENLYFRHTHLTRPYPVISPGGRRTGRTLSSNGFAAGLQAEKTLPAFGPAHDGLSSSTTSHAGINANASMGGTARALNGSSSSSSVGSVATLSIPSTPVPESRRIATPLAPHVGLGNGVTRYPITRSDSMSTVIVESTPSLYAPGQTNPSHISSSSTSTLQSHPNSTVLSPSSSQLPSTWHEPFDPMEPTEQLDSQLAALRSLISASSSVPIPLPPPSPAAPLQSQSAAVGSPGMASGLTYDAFWSAHGSASASASMSAASSSSYRAVLGGQAARGASAALVHASHAGAPAVLGSSVVVNGGTRAGDGAAGPFGVHAGDGGTR